MKRWLILVLVIALAVAAGVAWWLGSNRTSLAPIRLSDGSIITFRAVTFGTNHTTVGSLAQRLARVLPAKWSQRLGLRGPVMQTTQPVLVFWANVRRPPNRMISPRYVLGGEAGFAPVNSASSISSGMPNGEFIEGWGFEAFPRRGRTVTLRIYEQGSNWPDMKLMGEFTVRNPAQRNDPPWQPEPLPVTRRNDDFTVTLKDLLVGAGTSNLQQPRPAPNEPEAGVRAVFRFTRDGEPVHDWVVGSAVLSDATGNRAGSSTWTGTWQGHDFIAGFKPFLWTDEAAWNLKFEFTRQTNFAPAELWTVRGVPVGVADLTNNPAFGTNLQGASIQIERVESRNSYGNYESRRTWSVRLRVKPSREDYRLTLIDAVDDQGREGQRQSSSWGGGDHSFDVGVKTNASSLTLTLALHRSRYEEFRVKPVRMEARETNAPGADRRQNP